MYIDFINSLHTQTKRDYLGRVNEYPKAEAAKVAKKWGHDYWDGERRFGFGGYRYDSRWRSVAEKIASYYKLKPGDKVLDVGCGKGFLLYELTQVVPGIKVSGVDISLYAIENAKEEIRQNLIVGSAACLPFERQSFNLVFSINTLHNLSYKYLQSAVCEIERVGGNKYICVESWRNEEEKANLLFWQLTCESFYDVESWEWIFKDFGYTGDYSFVFFQ
jgi:SAM-dependent methyltransferase